MNKPKINKNKNNNNNIIETKSFIPTTLPIGPPLNSTASTIKDLEKSSKDTNSFKHQLDKCEKLEKTIKFLKLDIENKDKAIKDLSNRVTTLVGMSVNKTIYNSLSSKYQETKAILEATRIEKEEYKNKYFNIKKAVDRFNDRLITNILGLLVKY